MIIYTIMFISSILFIYLSGKTKNKKLKILFSVISSLPFIIVAGIRYDVGTDYMFRYVPDYLHIANGGTITNLEPLYLLLVNICIALNCDYYILFMITSVIIYALIFIEIHRNSDNEILSIAVFFLGSMFFISLNLMRQYIAIAILFISHKYLFEKNKIFQWIICLIIASLFHSVSLVFAIMLILKDKLINWKVLAICMILLLVFGDSIISLVLNLCNTIDFVNIKKYVVYLTVGGDFSFSMFIVEVLIYLYFLLSYFNIKKQGKEISLKTIFYMNCQSITLLCTILNIYNSLFVRIVFIFSIFQLLSIPYFYTLNKKNEFKLLKTKHKNKNINIVSICIILFFMTSRMVYSNVIKGSADVLPYKTIFDIEDTNIK